MWGASPRPLFVPVRPSGGISVLDPSGTWRPGTGFRCGLASFKRPCNPPGGPAKWPSQHSIISFNNHGPPLGTRCPRPRRITGRICQPSGRLMEKNGWGLRALDLPATVPWWMVSAGPAHRLVPPHLCHHQSPDLQTLTRAGMSSPTERNHESCSRAMPCVCTAHVKLTLALVLSRAICPAAPPHSGRTPRMFVTTA